MQEHDSRNAVARLHSIWSTSIEIRLLSATKSANSDGTYGNCSATRYRLDDRIPSTYHYSMLPASVHMPHKSLVSEASILQEIARLEAQFFCSFGKLFTINLSGVGSQVLRFFTQQAYFLSFGATHVLTTAAPLRVFQRRYTSKVIWFYIPLADHPFSDLGVQKTGFLA